MGKFTEVFGWVYSTKEVAMFEGITMDQAYDLPVTQVLNDMVYLKAKKKHEDAMIKNYKPKL